MSAAVQALTRGQLVAFPTDTVYGLACRADEQVARTRFYAAKRRPPGQPAILMAPDLARVEPWVVLTDEACRLAGALWPGPLTMIMRASDAAMASLGHLVSRGTLAVRIPAHPLALEMLAAVNMPLATSSANRAGEPTGSTAAEVRRALGDEVAVVLDGVPLLGTPSTILDVTRSPTVVVREGAIPSEQLLEPGATA